MLCISLKDDEPVLYLVVFEMDLPPKFSICHATRVTRGHVKHVDIATISPFFFLTPNASIS